MHHTIDAIVVVVGVMVVVVVVVAAAAAAAVVTVIIIMLLIIIITLNLITTILNVGRGGDMQRWSGTSRPCMSPRRAQRWARPPPLHGGT